MSDNFSLPVALHSYNLYVFFFYLFHIFIHLIGIIFHIKISISKDGFALINEDVICKNRGGTGESPKVCIGTDTSNFIA